MSQDDVLSVFEPGEVLTWPEIVDRCVARGNNPRTIGMNISRAHRSGRLESVGVDRTRPDHAMLKYAVVV